ncbi:MAG: iron-only hydrogenase system regulator [Negativicutes bacterium]|jgi:putative iron-only hydrogenase system regulator|nr:iron-only hydrogenase system regulator [Negativicutes bacterium]
MNTKIGVVAIVVEDFEKAKEVNLVLHEYGANIVGRMGIPYRERGVFVISVTVDGTDDEISGLTGKLGNIPSVTVKAALTKQCKGETGKC